jgi:NADPH-dependent curcumin reductase
MLNNQILLAQRPVGTPGPECWTFTKSETIEPLAGQVLIKTEYLSIDPAMRGWMNEGKSYIKPVEINEVMRALGIGQVINSGSEHFKTGDWVSANLGVQEYATLPEKEVSPIDITGFEPPAYLGTLGMSGLTAYFGILDTGAPVAGETVVVSGAAGAVGSVVGQIAKIKGCKVIGIAGGKDKCDYVVNELGFDACIDYKEGSLRKNLKEVCPDGVDVYFDNVGGEILDTLLTLINKKARIVICGAISQYNATALQGPKNYLSLLVNRAKMEGIVVFDNYKRYPEAIEQMKIWIKEGKLAAKCHVETGGVNAFPDVLAALFAGKNTGKLVLKF